MKRMAFLATVLLLSPSLHCDDRDYIKAPVDEIYYVFVGDNGLEWIYGLFTEAETILPYRDTSGSKRFIVRDTAGLYDVAIQIPGVREGEFEAGDEEYGIDVLPISSRSVSALSVGYINSDHYADMAVLTPNGKVQLLKPVLSF